MPGGEIQGSQKDRVSVESVYFFSLQISELHNTDNSVLPIMQLFNAFVAFMTCVSWLCNQTK